MSADIRRGQDTIVYYRSKKNGLSKVVRERYIRADIPCAVHRCDRCSNSRLADSGLQLLQHNFPYIAIPDVSVTSRYIEVFEHFKINNLVFCHTLLSALDLRDRTRTKANLRRIAADHQRHSVVFPNDVFKDTVIERMPGESLVDADMRAILRVAEWYQAHLSCQPNIPRIFLITTDERYPDWQRLSGSHQPPVLTLHSFLREYHPNLITYYFSLRDSAANLALDITLASPAEFAKRKVGAKANSNYQEYLPKHEIEHGLVSGALVQGVLKVLESKHMGHSKAIVSREAQGKPDILVIGSANRNRTVNGDIVVVRIIEKLEVEALLPRATATKADVSAVTAIAELETTVYSDGLEASSTEELDVKDAEDEFDVGEVVESAAIAGITSKDQEPLTTQKGEEIVYGRVVGVTQRSWRPVVATIKPDAFKASTYMAVPLDRKFPIIRIHYVNIDAIINDRIVVAIDEWPIDSQYPNGHFVRSLGPINELDTEINAILVEHNIAVSQSSLNFSEKCHREIPAYDPGHPWAPDPNEVSLRRDLRSKIIFSIDPKGSKDIDDALSMVDLGNGQYELGVHIADPTYFLPLGSYTDLEARSRGTTIYLSDRRFNMIPTALSEHNCSLRGGTDRYAVSVMWTLDHDFNVVDVWFGRSVIHSTFEMYYEQAQALLDGKSGINNLPTELEATLREPIRLLARAMRSIRERRRDKGALELESSEVRFQVDPETQWIQDIVPKQSLEIHKIVEEAMIMANSYVAERIWQAYSQSAVLRHHPHPNLERFRRLVSIAASKGFTIDCSSNKALNKSLSVINEQIGDKDPDFVFLLKSMSTLAMSEAQYIATGDYAKEQFHHYGLALEFYTHFTSPIRRYSDMMVHRQLLEALGENRTIELEHAVDKKTASMSLTSQRWISEVTSHLNVKTRESKFAQRDSTELFQSLYVTQMIKAGRTLVEDAIIAEVRTNGFMVYVPRFGIRCPVHLRDKHGNIKFPKSAVTGDVKDVDVEIACDHIEFTETKAVVKLSPGSGYNVSQVTFCTFDHLRVMLRVHESRAHWNRIYTLMVSPASGSLVGKPLQKRLDAEELEASIRKLELAERRPIEETTAAAAMIATESKSAPVQQLSEMYSILEKFGSLMVRDASQPTSHV